MQKIASDRERQKLGRRKPSKETSSLKKKKVVEEMKSTDIYIDIYGLGATVDI
jgi:hypothetical protein